MPVWARITRTKEKESAVKKVILSDSLFREAVIKACERENELIDKMAEKEPEPGFSEKFREKVMRLCEDAEDIKEAETTVHPARKISRMSLRIKIVLIAAIIMVFGSMTVVGTDPMHQMTFKMFEVGFPDHTDITFGEKGGSTIEINESSGIRTYDPADFLKRLTWVPKEFELDTESVYPDMCVLDQFYVYIDPKGEWHQITYTQAAIENCGGTSITSDGKAGKEISICGDTGYWYTDESGYRNIVMEKDGLMYVIGGNVETDILVRCLASAFERVPADEGGIPPAGNAVAAGFPRKFKWLPKNYVLESKEEYPEWAAYEYRKEGTLYDYIRYEQIKIDQSTWKVAEDGNQIREILVGPERAYLRTDDEGNFPKIILAKDGVEYRVSGDCEVDEMIRCLESALDMTEEN